MNKIELLDKYIQELTNVIPTDIVKVEMLIEDVTKIILSQDDVHSLALYYYMSDRPNYIKDIRKLKSKLEYDKAVLLDELEKAILITKEEKEKRELERLRLQSEISKNGIQVNAYGGSSNANSTANSSSIVTISIEQTIGAIDEIPSDVLSEEEKERLQNDLYTLEGIKTTKNKKKFWDKAKPILSFLTEKGADALIAVAPYIITALQTM